MPNAPYAPDEQFDRKLRRLSGRTIGAYNALANGADPDAVYAELKAMYAEHGLSADVAESSVDWYEGNTLHEDLSDAIRAAE